MKKTLTLRGLGLLAALAALLGTAPGALAQVENATLYEGARLIIGDESPPIENSAFLVENGRFSRIGRRGEVQAPAGADRVDLTGKTVMPAILDAHDHMGIGRGTDAWLDEEAQRQELITELHQYAYAGIAVVTSMGWVSEPAFQIRSEYHPDASRMLVSGRGVSVPLAHMPETIERHEAGLPSRWEEDMTDVTEWIHNRRQAQIFVRERSVQRVDHIKMWVDDRLGTELSLSPELYSLVIDEAHKRNIPVYVHIWHMRDAKGVVRAGADMLAHPVRGDFIDDEFVQLMKDHNAVQQTNMRGPWTYTMTLADGPTYWEDPLFLELSTPQQAERERTRAAEGPEPRTHEGQAPDSNARELNGLIYEHIVSNHRRLFDEGVRIAIGTEGGAFSAHQTMQLLVDDVGLTPQQAITIATRNTADALRQTDLGTVKTGKTASFIVLNANPLENITNTRRIADVYLYGHKVDRDMIRRTYLPNAVTASRGGQ